MVHEGDVRMTSRDSVVIIGSGIAGLVAASVLVRQGYAVTLLEASAIPGGKLASWRDADGDSVEHGHHFWLDQYNNLNRLLPQMGVGDVFWEPAPGFDLVYTSGQRCSVTPRHFGTLTGLADLVRKLPGLSAADRRAGILGCVRLAACSWEERSYYDQLSALAWFRAAGVTPTFIRQFLDPVIGGVLFAPLRDLSFAAALCGRHSINPSTCRVRWLRGSMAACVVGPIIDHLRSAGCRVLLGHRVLELVPAGGRVGSLRVRQPDGAEVHLGADWVVSATNVSALRHLLVGAWADHPDLRHIHRLGEQPVITARIWFGRPVYLGGVTNGHVIGHGLDTFLMFVVQSAIESGATGSELVFETQMGPAEPYMRWPDEDLTALLLSELGAAFPELRGVRPRKAAISRFPAGFTAFPVGSASLRPGTHTSVPNLLLAGDWLACNLPVLAMERATVTGLQAANAILTAGGLQPEPVLAPQRDGRTVPLQAAARVWNGAARGLQRLLGYQRA